MGFIEIVKPASRQVRLIQGGIETGKAGHVPELNTSLRFRNCDFV
jgi:hypothetical protein